MIGAVIEGSDVRFNATNRSCQRCDGPAKPDNRMLIHGGANIIRDAEPIDRHDVIVDFDNKSLRNEHHEEISEEKK
jgi:hypothetical protein